MFAFDYLSVTVRLVRYTTCYIVDCQPSKVQAHVADTRVVLFCLALAQFRHSRSTVATMRRHILFDLFCYRSSEKMKS